MDPASIASNALGTVLGYIGAEAATSATFTRLLWPQRAYAHMRVGDMIKMALLLPAGGPLYKACLEVLDGAARNGLLQGKAQGHMLGSAFFPNEDGTYTQHCVDEKKHEEASRNNLWSRVMTLIPLPDFGDRPTDTEKGSIVMPKIVRGRVAVHQLTLHVEPCDGRAERASNACAPTDAETGFPKIEAFYGILVTELSAIVLSVIIGTVWHSWFALLWLCPVALKLLSAACALSRDPLHLKSDSEPSEPSECFEVHMPAETGRFLIITSPPSLVTQFFRHYGHPQRDRSREVLQLAIVVAFALLFPIGLLCSLLYGCRTGCSMSGFPMRCTSCAQCTSQGTCG